MINIIGNAIGAKISGGAAVNEAFEFTVQTDNAGTSASDQFTIPTTGAGYNYDISTSDGQTITGATGDTTITFPSAGSYTIEVTGDFPRIYFNNGGDKSKLTDIKNWGSIAWTSMQNAFLGCRELTNVTATDAPDLSNATRMSSMFTSCFSLTSLDVSSWDVSTITHMDNAFQQCFALQQLDASSWDVSNVTTLQLMFSQATVLTTVNCQNWDVSSVSSFRSTFAAVSSFNDDISGWQIKNSGSVNMQSMFSSASSFNQDIGNWDVSNVTNMSSMFEGATSFNQDLSAWDTSSVTSLSNTFQSTTASSFGIANWDVSNVNNFNATFRFNTSFNEDISGWDITGATSNFNDTFSGCQSFNQPIGNWNITSSVTKLSNLLVNAISFDQDLSSWNISGVTLFNNFAQGVTLSTANYDALLVAWESQTPVFSGSVSFGSSQYSLGSAAETARTSLINTYGWTITDGGGVAEVPFIMNVRSNNGTLSYIVPTNPSYTYDYNISTSDGQSFSNLTGDKEIFFPAGNTDYDIEITGTFPGLYVNQVLLSSRINEIKQWGSQVWRTFDSAFYGCSFLANVTATDDPNTNLVDSMSRAFFNCGPMVGIDFSTWNTSNVTTFSETFRGTQGSAWHSQVVNWNTSKATSMFRMFANLSYNQDLSNWDVSSVTNFGQMFTNNNVIDQSFAAWNIGQATLVSTAFSNFISTGTLSTANYDATLISWAAQAPTSNVGASFGNSQFTLGGAAEAARNTLINTYGWTITDGGGVIAPFQFTVDTTLGDGLPEYEIRTNGSGYNYDVVTSDGQTINGNTGNLNITFPSAGQYTVEIRGAFPHHWGFGAPDSLKLIDVSEWGAIAWSSMEYMFYQHSNLTVSATDAPILSAVTNMRAMFQQTAITNNDFTSWNTSNVTNMGGLFRGATFNGDVSTWNTSNVTNMTGTFATGSFNGDITAWDVSSVTTFNECFLNASSFNQDISGWNTSSATTFRWMFYNAYQFNADISGWNTSSLTSLELTFRNAIMFDQDISGWDINGVTTFDNLFLSTVGPSQDNYDAILIGWEAQAPLTGKSINFAEATFTPGGAAEAARTSLINTYGWTITDGGPRAAQTSGFLLDDYPGAAAAYSFRQLSISTPVVAQLSTTNSSTDFRDFTATEMQRRLHQILGFRSLRTFYDQSGNGRHADDGNMLLENGTSGLVDGYPVARTNSGFGTMFTPQQTLSIDNSSIFFVGKITAGGNLFNYSSSTAPVGGGRLLYADQNLVNFSSTSNDFSSNFTMNTSGLSLSYGIQNGQNVDLYHDAQTASGSTPSAVVTATNQYFGLTNVYPTTSGGPVNSAEFVFYPDDQSANATGIRDNINEFYLL